MQKKGGKGNGDPSFPYHIPVERVAVVIEKYIEKYVERAPQVNEEHNHGSQYISNQTGLPCRRIYGILKREYQSVTFDTADKLFIGLELLDLWHQPPEEGGFADLYECETVQPPLPPLTPYQAEVRAKNRADRLRQQGRVAA